MAPHHTPPAWHGQDDPYSNRDNIIEIGQRRRRHRERTGTAPAPLAPIERRSLRPGSILGYFQEQVPLQVTYGSSHNLWIKAADEGPNARLVRVTWDDFTHLDHQQRYRSFAVIAWQGGTTTFTYHGPNIEPHFMPLHSPFEAVIQYKALALYWHVVEGYGLRPSHRILVNPDPEYLDPTNPSQSL